MGKKSGQFPQSIVYLTCKEDQRLVVLALLVLATLSRPVPKYLLEDTMIQCLAVSNKHILTLFLTVFSHLDESASQR